jgi:hypothetical protein
MLSGSGRRGSSKAPAKLYLVRDPVDVLRAAESGVDNAVSFLCEITSQMLEMLSSLMGRTQMPQRFALLTID